MNIDKYNELADRFEGILESNVEYQTEHADTGDSYSHLAREGGWHYHNGLDRLKQWIAENDISIPSGFDWEGLEDEVLGWHEMEPGHIFSGGSDSKRFVIDSYPVGEVEDQYCISDLSRCLEISKGEAMQFINLAMSDNRFCLRDNCGDGVLSYTNTDAVWLAVVSKRWVQDRVDWAREEIEGEECA